MLAGRFDRGGMLEHRCFFESPDRHDASQARLSLRQGARLVDDDRGDLLEPLERSGVLDQDALAGASPDPDHDRHRRSEPERARTGDDQHRHGDHDGVRKLRRRPDERPHDRRGDRDDDDRRHEDGRDLVDEPLHGGARALRLRDHVNDLRQQCLAADALRAHQQSAAAVRRPRRERRARGFSHRLGLARQHGFVDMARAFGDGAIDGHALAGPNSQEIADADVLEWHVAFAAARIDAVSHPRRKLEQRADCPGGVGAGAQLQHLPEQHQRDNDRRGLEIQRRRARLVAERRRQNAGDHSRDDRKHPGCARAERDQREHVEAAVDDRLPTAHKEWPAGPEHDWSRERELRPGNGGMREQAHRVDRRNELAEHRPQQRHRQRDANPKAPRHVL
jgi:hypothetical protein